MKKLLTLTTLLFLTTTSFTHANFDDSRFTTDTVVQIGSYTLNIVGTSTSVVVNDTNLVATLDDGSFVTITSPTRNQLTTNVSTGVTNTCNSSVSQLVVSGSTAVTVTPTATICADTVISTPPTSSSGGSSGRYIPPLLIPPTTAPTITNTNTTFTKDLDVGIQGDDVKSLQKFLNSKGYTVSTTGPGSIGNETNYFGMKTREALIQFQKQNNIIPAIGYFGPLTRAVISKLLTNTTLVNPQIISTATSTAKTNIFTYNLTLGSEGDDVTRLQTILNTQGYLTVSPTGYFGYLTLQAVKAYQKSKGISDTGYVGPLTRAELGK